MRIIRAHIAARQEAFSRHRFFEALGRAPSMEAVMQIAPQLTFWVLAFQDVLRLNEKLVTEPALKRIARHHKAEDAGHEQWFLADLAQFSIRELDARVLFGPTHRVTRDAAYALVSEVFRADSDLLRIVLVLALESTGHVFFDRMARFVEAKGFDERLQYLSDRHLQVERAHEVFEHEMLALLDARILSAEQRERAMALVDRAYTAFDAMFDGLRAELEARASQHVGTTPRPSDPPARIEL